MIVLLPPSEGKSSEPGKGMFGDLYPELLGDTQPVLKHLRGLKGVEISKCIGVKQPDKAKEWQKTNLAVAKAGCIPALERYTGVVYQYLDYGSLTAKRRAASRLVTVSGLFGAIKGGMKIPEYKLPMNPWLVKYWKPINSERVAGWAKKGAVLSLLSQSYAKALDLEGVLTVDFKVQGGKKSAGHFGKAIKGRFVRFLIENDVTNAKDFGGFTEEGYRFNGSDFVQD